MHRDYIKFLDSTEDQFLKAFKGNFGDRIFELVMADFIGKKFQLRERPKEHKKNGISMPDLEFVHNNKLYYLECTTRNTSLIDRYVYEHNELDVYFEIADLLYKKYEELKRENAVWEQSGWHTYGVIFEIYHRRLDEKERKSVGLLMQQLKVDNVDDLIVKLAEWIDFNKRIYNGFRDILPLELVHKLEQRIIPVSLVKLDLFDANHLNFIIKSLVLKILEKVLKGSYFSHKMPVIIAISLSLLPDSMDTVVAINYCHNLESLLSKELKEVLNSSVYSQEEIKKILKNMKYLYAIIVDSSWYNWFPDILEKEHHKKLFPDGYGNSYRVIYNINLAEDINCDINILDSLIKNGAILSLTSENNGCDIFTKLPLLQQDT